MLVIFLVSPITQVQSTKHEVHLNFAKKIFTHVRLNRPHYPRIKDDVPTEKLMQRQRRYELVSHQLLTNSVFNDCYFFM